MSGFALTKMSGAISLPEMTETFRQVAAWMLGAIWYAAPVFGKAWMQGVGKTKEEVEKDYSPLKMLWALIGYLVAGYGIARMMSFTMGDSLVDGLHIGLLGAVCLVAAPMAVGEIMEHRPLKLYFINALYVVIAFVIMGAIIGAWR
jgi:hypothetical protein